MAISYKNGAVNTGEATPYPIATGTPADGVFLVADADGKVTEATAGSAALLGRARPYYGDTVMVGVDLATEDKEFVVKASGAVSQALVNAYYDLVVASDGSHQVNLSASSTNVFKVTAIEDAALRLLRVIVNPAVSQATNVEV